MQIESLLDLLRGHRYMECRAGALELQKRGGLGPSDLAWVFWALSRSQAALKNVQEAFGPAELAVYFSRESKLYNLLGEALVHLAALCVEIRLFKRATGALEDYFRHFTLYGQEARSQEGQVFHLMGLSHQALGRPDQALEYHDKAYQWHKRRSTDPQAVEAMRAALVWQHLLMGQTEPTAPLLAESEAYLNQYPNDLDAKAQFWNNLAYWFHLQGRHRDAIETATRVAVLRGAAPARKARAFLILHQTARSIGYARVAIGLGIVAKIQATVARRPDMEEEINRSLWQMQHPDTLPHLDELFHELSHITQDWTTGECPASFE